MLLKNPPIKNPKLLKTMSQPCHCCGRYRFNAVHHHIRRSDIRLDVVYNLSVLCVTCHDLLHFHKDKFVSSFGEDKYIYYTTLKSGMTVDKIYEKYGICRI